jgi:methylglutaconyl-CoA hydratase
MTAELLVIEHVEAGLVRVTLNRPDARNALSNGLMSKLCQTLDELEGGTCRVVVLCGAGRGFCAGLDLREAADDSAQKSADRVSQLLATLGNTALVTIAAAHGFAMAGGAGLMAACDLVVATESLRIAFPEVRRGLVPALVSEVLRRRMREGDLRELLLCAEPVDARRACALGLVNHIVPEDQLLAAADALARQVLLGAPHAVRSTKQLLRSAWPDAHRTQSRLLETHRQARVGDEAREGLAAFLEKRKPRWVGTQP